jgi:hypothetical protein
MMFAKKWGAFAKTAQLSSAVSLFLAVIFQTAPAVPVQSLALPALQAGSINPPILLIVNSAADNKFGAYLGEILRAEGLNAFDQVELNDLTDAQLAKYDLAILAQTPLSSAQAMSLTTYVQNGGALLAMRPDPQIADIFGLGANAGVLSNGYLQIQPEAMYAGSMPGSGLISATLQIHGDADQYTTTVDSVTLAQLYSTTITSTIYPAVVAGNSGSGQAVAFTYDLASNVAYTRQGNPANANLYVDGDYYTRTVNLFQAIGSEAQWVDQDKIPIPQADEQQRLFARVVQQLIGRHHPLPQFWYFPETAKTMQIMTSDAHQNSIADYNDLIGDVTAHQGRVTVYLSDMDLLNGNSWDWPSDADLHTWQMQGHTFGIHPWRSDGSTMAAGFISVTNWFTSTYTVLPSLTTRIHRLEWQDWTGAADVESANNIAMDTSFYNWGKWLQNPDGTWSHGYMTGSGLPMKFVRSDGTLTSVYQQLTEMADDQLLPVQGGFEGLTGAQAVALSQSLIDASLAGNYSALLDNHHIDNYSTAPELSMWLTGVIDYAHSKGVPVWNADQWLSFTKTRHDANFQNIAWNSVSQTLSFDIVMSTTAGFTPTTILPLSYGGVPLYSVKVDGGKYGFITQTVKSTDVAFVSIAAGNHDVTAIYCTCTTAVSLFTFTARSDGITWWPIGLVVPLLAVIFAWHWRRFKRQA